MDDINTMDPTLTWEILSLLSLPSASANDTTDSDADPDDHRFPFFAQRECKKAKSATRISADPPDNTSLDKSQRCQHDVALFFSACPLRLCDSRLRTSKGLPALYAREAIADEFLRVLRRNSSGRAPASDLCLWLGMAEDRVTALGGWLCGQSAVRRVRRVYNPTKRRHEYALVKRLCARLREGLTRRSTGARAPSLEAIASPSSKVAESLSTTTATLVPREMAWEMELTCEDVVWLMETEGMHSEENTPETVEISSSQPGQPLESRRSQVAAAQLQRLEKQILSSLLGVTVPTSLESCLFGRGGEEAMIPSAKALCRRGRLHGALAIPAPSSATVSHRAEALLHAIFTPRMYSHSQRQIANTFFDLNGYLTEKKCVALGLSRSRMEAFVKESFPNAVLLADSIINPTKICRPLEQIIQDAIISRSFANMQFQLPDDLASSEDDLRKITRDHMVVDGLTIIRGDLTIFFSKQMTQDCKQLLMPLVDNFCKKRAKELQTDALVQSELLPLFDVATAIGKKYSALLELQRQHDNDYGQKRKVVQNMLWTVEERDNATHDGPLVEFCRQALFSAELRQACTRSLALEVERRESTRLGASVSPHTEGAAKTQTIRESFEASFRTFCHLLQIFAKSLDTLCARAQQGNNNTVSTLEVDAMRQELLLGCGSHLARLITEYCLFKHAGEIETATGFFFENCGERAEESYDITALRFPCIVLKGGLMKHGEPQSPLDCLRSAFPGSTGANLANMWSLCSNNGTDDSKNIFDAGQKLELFIQQLKETCLTLVGVPFSVLDKKTERKVLAARREGLLERLEAAQGKEEVLRCATVLIYYQVKNLSIAGVETINFVMTRLFGQDKKIPQRVNEALQILKSKDCTEASELVAQVKKFGSAKNSKTLAAVAEATA